MAAVKRSRSQLTKLRSVPPQIMGALARSYDRQGGKKMWCLSELNLENVEKMKDVLTVCKRP